MHAFQIPRDRLPPCFHFHISSFSLKHFIKQFESKMSTTGVAAKVGNWTFKAFTAGLGLTTIYLTATFSLNVYNGISWHKQQQKLAKDEESREESQ